MKGINVEQSDFSWLQKWYQIQCKRTFAPEKLIHLGTIDNPGWSFRINLKDIEFEHQKYQEFKLDRSDEDWIFCKIEDHKFESACGAFNLPEILYIFRTLANNPLNPIGSNLIESKVIENCDFLWIQNWYQIHCDGDWEHTYRIHFKTTSNSGWSFTVGLEDTELEGKKFQDIKLERSKDDWIFCTIKKDRFEGTCGLANLPEILKIFRAWTEE